MSRSILVRAVGVFAVLLALMANPSWARPLLAAPAGVDIRQNGSLTISGDLVEGSQVYIDIPIKNFGSSTSPHLHTYTEGYTAKGSLWRADGANPTAVALGPGQKVTIRVKADLWAGHIGTWTTYGVYLWNDDNNTYISPLAANGYNQSLAFAVTLNIRQNGPVQVSGTLVEGNKVYLTVPVKNFSSSASPALHPYVEGLTGAGSLWRADGAQPASVVLQPGQSTTFQVQQDLWVGHAGTWKATGVYLWNNSANGYYGPLVANGYDQHFSFSVAAQANLVLDGQIGYLPSYTSGGVVVLTIPVRNIGGTASVPFHPYTEGYTAKHSLWRADGASPTGVVLQPGESRSFTVRHDLWPGHEGLWTTYGVYLWNDSNQAYLSPLGTNGHNEQISFNVTTPQAFSLQLPVRPTPGVALTDYIWSYFDHQYPLLWNESPAAVTDSILTWKGGSPQPGTKSDCTPRVTCYSGHDGLDFSYHVWDGEDVLAANAGMASGVIWDCNTGDQTIRVLLVDNGLYRTVYEHVKDDDLWRSFHDHPRPVAAGDVIAHIGNTGWEHGCSNGSHLHFGVYFDPDGTGYKPGMASDRIDKVDPMGFPGSQVDPWVHDLGGAPSRWLWAFRLQSQADVAPGSPGLAQLDDSVVRADISGGQVDAPATLNLTLAIAPDAGPAAMARVAAGAKLPQNITIAVGAPFNLDGQYAAGGNLIAFQSGIPLTITYQAAEAAYVDASSIRAYRWDASGQAWIALPGSVDTSGRLVTATTDQPGVFRLRGTPLYGAPVLAAVTPLQIQPGADTSLTITGSGFLPGASVNLGHFGLQVTAVSANSLTAVVPADMLAAAYALTVENPDGQLASQTVNVLVGYQTWLPVAER